MTFKGPASVSHMGALHPIEMVAVVAVAFGPFLALAIWAVLRRQQEGIGADMDPELDRPDQTGRTDRS
jgi:hypothetical protein